VAIAMPSVPFSFRLDQAIRGRLEEEALSLDRSSSYVVKKAIEAFLDSSDAKRNALKAAISEADKGHFISEEAMDAWVASWGSKDELPAPNPDITPNSGIL
jgi:predicted transcriptional regulator